jgi:hypothetical protein
MTGFAGVIRTPADAQVDFILVGGVAATVHGSARLTRDAVDVVYARTPANMTRLVDALALHHHDFRSAPEGRSRGTSEDPPALAVIAPL